MAHHQRHWYGLEYDPDTEVLITVGATEAIASVIMGIVEPGDEVIAFEPYYDSYAAMISMAGGTRVPVTLRAPDFAIDLDELRKAVTPRTRMILVNSPHNPTGAVFSRAEQEAIAELCVEHDLIAMADEVYEHLNFTGDHVPLASLPGMADRTISIGSAGKCFSFTGWKVGWACARPELIAATRCAKQFFTYVGSGPFQWGIAEALRLPDSYFTGLRESMRAKRDLLSAGLRNAGFTVYDSKGTYFVTTDVRSLGFDDGLDLCRRLPELAGVVGIPCSVFYDDKEAGRALVRFAFCKRDEVLTEACERLAKLKEAR